MNLASLRCQGNSLNPNMSVIQNRAALLVLLCSWFNQFSFAATIFDNSANDSLSRFNPGAAVIGDQINFTGTERYLTRFDFEYWGANSANAFVFAGSVQARVIFYLNDGPEFNGYATPGTSFFDSDWFSIKPTDRSTLVFSAGSDFSPSGLFIPESQITWTVQFTGMSATDSVGVDLYSPPAVGFDAPEFWQNSGGGWQLLTNAVPMNFGARFFASQEPVPEPSVPILFSGALIFFAARRFRSRQLFQGNSRARKKRHG